MGSIVALEVNTVSIETVRPSSPTPSHLQTYTLSLIDQIRSPHHSIMLLFYPQIEETTCGGLNIDVLKTTLSRTLSIFYPFAGRLNDEFTVSCNDAGIPFIETHVNCLLSDFLSSPNKIDHMHKLTPSQEFMKEKSISELVPLAFQINKFSCGGIVIGCFKLHKLLLDGTSLAAFLKHWAVTAASGHDRNILPVAPDFDAVLSAFPPRPSLRWRPYSMNNNERQAIIQQYDGVHVVANSFVFSKHAIDEIRVRAAWEEVSKPTRVTALAGFVWKHCLAAAYAGGSMPLGPEPAVMTLLVDMRPRLNPPLTQTSMGNLLTTTSARAKDGMGLSRLAREIHAAVSDINERIESYERGQNMDALSKDIAPARYFPGTYTLSSWSQFRLDEVDFGFGKPKWVSPTNGILSPLNRNIIYFIADTKTEGIEAWLFLEEKEMQILKSNKEFLAFACPR